ncbi:DUF488 family protein [Halobacillus fulvus]|nr:DUF488 family protein [Halobacillus fulvus]
MSIVLRRIYEDDPPLGGHRVLVDRVWPRGISKEDADLDEWKKDIAPTSDLRRWFNHDPDKFEEFKDKYKDELHEKDLSDLKEKASGGRVVLLYGAKDQQHNHAVVLKEVLENDEEP